MSKLQLQERMEIMPPTRNAISNDPENATMTNIQNSKYHEPESQIRRMPFDEPKTSRSMASSYLDQDKQHDVSEPKYMNSRVRELTGQVLGYGKTRNLMIRLFLNPSPILLLRAILCATRPLRRHLGNQAKSSKDTTECLSYMVQAQIVRNTTLSPFFSKRSLRLFSPNSEDIRTQCWKQRLLDLHSVRAVSNPAPDAQRTLLSSRTMSSGMSVEVYGSWQPWSASLPCASQSESPRSAMSLSAQLWLSCGSNGTSCLLGAKNLSQIANRDDQERNHFLSLNPFVV
jgi:hypothetical protein